MTATTRPAAKQQLEGVAFPLGRAKRLLIVDRTSLIGETWRRFDLADLYIAARTPVVFTMSRANLLRVKETVDTAVSEFESRPESSGLAD
ncbi:hypothetical protein [Actinopolyspora xinjiangensis]|uniref:hypothetical protein n=1 Tax=Actinopolyspora xinjiangensis TaxID=405564 RepID=UPI000B880E32|nr:hypothetical protein [Actinopolyspora xinjiangensis]